MTLLLSQKNTKKKSGYINLDLKKSKEGKLYLELNSWEKKETEDIVEASDPF